jgi:penicillin G amidase
MGRRLRRWLLAIGLGLAALVVTAAGAVGWLAWASLPQIEGEIELAGLKRPVRVLRDAHAIPHIEAGTVRDAYLAMGFLHGQDRLWQMEFNRLVGQGRLAELLGGAALPFDRFLRTLGLTHQAEAALGQASPATLALLQSYADGVNGAIAAYGVALPPEFLLLRHRPEPWRPVDTLLFQKLMALDLSLNWREELLRARLARRLTPGQLADLWPGAAPGSPVTMAALASLPLDRLAAALPVAPPPGTGSNVWVVDGSRTRSGLPLLANDPHLRLQLPGQWYLAHLEAPGLSVVGATLPSLPFVVLGRNRDIAWGFTNTGSDTQDLFVERVDPADPDRYLAPGGSEPFRRRGEAIAVRGAPAVTLDVRETRHGPVISDLVPADAAEQGHVLALAWTQLQGKDRTVEAGFAIGQARDWPSFVAAVEPYHGAQQNMAFADRRGTVGMISPGLVPVRRAGDGTLPVPGWTGEHDWLGTTPPGKLPRKVRPVGGLLLNANNRLVGDDYPYLLTHDWEPTLRASRLQTLLGDARALDADRFAAVQLDVVSPLAQGFLPYLLAIPPAGQREREMLAGLAGWDRAMRPDRPEPVLFSAWYRELSAAVYADELGPLFDDYRGLRPDFMRLVLARRPVWCDDVATAATETCPEQVARAFQRAVADLTARYGPDWRRWRWGEAHPAVLAHRPFEQSGFLRRWFSLLLPVGGDGSTVAVAHAGATRADVPFGAVHAAGYRAIYDLVAPDRSRWIAAVGQSGHPFSRHRRDMAAAWREGGHVAMTTRPDEYRRGAVGSLALLPAPPR